MSETEKSLREFLQRWSRRKLGWKEPSNELPPARTEPTASTGSNAPGAPKPPRDASGASADSRPSDLPHLPPIESIDGSTDVRPFLGRMVPAELTRAALRRAWLSDPAIRDFVGLAENQWDFNKPETVPGFGALELTPELRRLIADLFDRPPQQAAALESQPVGTGKVEEVERTPPSDRELIAAAGSGGASPVDVSPTTARYFAAADVAAHNDQFESAPTKPKHGGALPD